MKPRIAAMFLISLALASGHALAGPDESLRVAQRMAAAAKQKLAAAQAAKGAERRNLMAEHMKMMGDVNEAGRRFRNWQPLRLRQAGH